MNHQHKIVVQNLRYFRWRMRTRFHVVSWIVVHKIVLCPMLHTPVLVAVVGDCQV